MNKIIKTKEYDRIEFTVQFCKQQKKRVNSFFLTDAQQSISVFYQQKKKKKIISLTKLKCIYNLISNEEL